MSKTSLIKIYTEKPDIPNFILSRVIQSHSERTLVTAETIYKSYVKWRKEMGLKPTIFSVNGLSRFMPESWERSATFMGGKYRRGFFGICIKDA